MRRLLVHTVRRIVHMTLLFFLSKSNFEFESFTQLEWNLLRAFQYYVTHSSITTPELSKAALAFSESVEEKLNSVMQAAAVKFKWNTLLFEANDVVLTHVIEYLRKHSPKPSASSDDGPMDLSASNSRNVSPVAVLDEESLKEVTYSLLVCETAVGVLPMLTHFVAVLVPQVPQSVFTGSEQQMRACREVHSWFGCQRWKQSRHARQETQNESNAVDYASGTGLDNNQQVA